MASQSQFEVLSPWAEVDPVAIKGLSPRLTSLKGKTIGLLYNWKMAGVSIEKVVERKLKEIYPTIKTTWFFLPERMCDLGAEKGDQAYLGVERKAELINWINGVDAVVAAVGD
jgi:hypothetical protein